MALKIRLARRGAKKLPFYHIVVADVRAPRDGRFIEKLGFYNPLIAQDAASSPEAEKAGRVRLKMDQEKIKHWLSRGAKPSDRVARFLEHAELITAKTRANPNKAKPKAKAQARAEAARAKKAEAKPEPKPESAKTESAETQSAETESTKPKSAETESAETESTKPKSAKTESAETKSAETKSTETKSAKPKSDGETDQ